MQIIPSSLISVLNNKLLGISPLVISHTIVSWDSAEESGATTMIPSAF